MTGREVKEIRNGLGFTQERLAVLLGVHINTLQKWEDGTNPVPGPAALALRLLFPGRSGSATATAR